MGAGEQILQAVNGVLAAVARVEGKLDLLVRHLGANRGATGEGAPAAGRVADLREIDGDKGDPKIRMVPKRWTGENYKGSRASRCSPDFLDMYADQLDWFADNPKEGEDPKKAKWDRLDAARCRRWAVEIREGRVQQDGAPAASPTPRSQGEPDPWAGEGDTSGGWGDEGTF